MATAYSLDSAQLNDPRHICDRHRQEWLASGVSPEIIEANVRSLSGAAVYDYLFYSDNVHRTNTGRLSAFYLKTYVTLEDGGWWCSGLDPQNHWQPMLWGQFKGDRPRQAFKLESEAVDQGKTVKYEPPPGTPTRAYFLDVSPAIADRIYQAAKVKPTPEDASQGFWHCVLTYKLPIILVEGAKKAGALLSAGYAAIGLPGISSGYRATPRTPGRSKKSSPKDRHLIPDLQPFVDEDRQIFICFDHDQKPSTRAAVQVNTLILGSLWEEQGCAVKVISLPGPEKGVDDFIVARSPQAFDDLYTQALPLRAWQVQCSYQLTYPPNLVVNQRYLDIPLPSRGLVCIKSPKGTGKTSLLEGVIQTASREGRKTLVIGHRIQLTRAICQLFGLAYVTERKQSETSSLFGFGLCIDSLHAHSQAQFNVHDWHGAVVVLDECEQVIWHALNSSTCQKERVRILETFRYLIYFVLSTGGLVIAQDADLSDFSIDLLQAYGNDGQPAEETPWATPWIGVNTWKPEIGWPLSFYRTPDPAALWSELEKTVAQGPVFVCMDSQKSKAKWGTVNVEARLKEQFPEKRILRIDSETVANPDHPAQGFTNHITQLFLNYDIVIASPSIGTGISFDVPNYFVAVFGIFQGTIPDSEIRQAIARVRDPVPRHLWVRHFGLGSIGNGSIDYRHIGNSIIQVQKANLQLLRDVDFNLDSSYDPITFRTWAKIAARTNLSLGKLRDTLEAALRQEGHQVTIVGVDSTKAAELKAISNAQRQVRDQSYRAEGVAVAEAADISEDAYEALRDQRQKTTTERQQEEKYRLQQQYGIEVTPELWERHQKGWYQQLRMHYYLTHPTEYVRSRDRQHWNDQLRQGEGRICPQDLRTYSAQVEALKHVGILDVLTAENLHQHHPITLAVVERALQWATELRSLFRITVKPEMSKMQIVQRLVGLLGLKIKRQHRVRCPIHRRVWLFAMIPPADDRDRIFAVWTDRAHALSGHPPDSNEHISAEQTPDPVASPSMAAQINPPESSPESLPKAPPSTPHARSMDSPSPKAIQSWDSPLTAAAIAAPMASSTAHHPNTSRLDLEALSSAPVPALGEPVLDPIHSSAPGITLHINLWWRLFFTLVEIARQLMPAPRKNTLHLEPDPGNGLS
jgi:hypothetical protein